MSPEVPLLLHIFSNFVCTGPELRTVRIINALGSTYRHVVLSIDPRTDARQHLDPGIEAEILKSPRKDGPLTTVRDLHSILGRVQPDLILSYGWAALDGVVAARIRGWHRVIHHEDGFNIDESRSFKLRRILARRLVLPGVHRVVVPSELLRRVALDHWRLVPEKVKLIRNGIDVERFGSTAGRNEARASLGIPMEAVVAGSVGQLRPVKNLPRFVEALSAVGADHPVHGVVLGEGPDRHALMRKIEEMGLSHRVHLVGHQADPAPWYAAMDLFVISSDSEQMPVALLEAMASGLPVASTDVGDVRHILPPEGAPFVVPRFGHSAAGALGHAIGMLACDAELRRRLGRANRLRVEKRYGFERMLTAYQEIYRAALLA